MSKPKANILPMEAVALLVHKIIDDLFLARVIAEEKVGANNRGDNNQTNYHDIHICFTFCSGSRPIQLCRPITQGDSHGCSALSNFFLKIIHLTFSEKVQFELAPPARQVKTGPGRASPVLSWISPGHQNTSDALLSQRGTPGSHLFRR